MLCHWLCVTECFHVCVLCVCLSLSVHAFVGMSVFVSVYTIYLPAYNRCHCTPWVSVIFLDLYCFSVFCWPALLSLSLGQCFQLYLFILLWLQMDFAVFLFMQRFRLCQHLPVRKVLQRLGASTSLCSKYSGFLLHIETFTALFVISGHSLVHSVQTCHQIYTWLYFLSVSGAEYEAYQRLIAYEYDFWWFCTGVYINTHQMWLNFSSGV